MAMAESPDAAIVAEIARLVRAAERILFITGAGVSADSGLPTYRGIGGLYDREVTDEGFPIEVALSGAMLRDRPEVCWKYIHQIEAACRGATFNRAHEIIAQIERRVPGTWVLTQNVDGFHARAGSRNVIEIHGNVEHLVCTKCTWSERVTSFEGLTPPPKCPGCDALVRPKVVLFGEMLPEDAVGALQRELDEGFDLVFSIGTTSVFPYIAAPVVLARRAGIPTIEINPGETEVSGLVAHRLRCGAAAAMEALWTQLSW